MLEKNKILQGRYQIIRSLGHGGMGTVYEAKDTKLFGKSVALKEILLDKNLFPNQKDLKIVRRAFEREAKILTKLQHEAFPQIIDYFVEKDHQFLVMELIQGKDLGELLRKRKSPFEVEEVLGWANQILDALDYLHTLTPPTIHRDIKPSNLKLSPRKKIKLLDFGIAKGADFPTNLTLTKHTFVAATFNYSPFEQVFRVLDPSIKEALKPVYEKQLEDVANQPADARSDIYALGATLYHLLTKKLPLDSLKRTLEHWAGHEDPLESLHSLNPNIPLEVSDWILKAMAVDREDRFDSAITMKNALQLIISEDKLLENSNRQINLTEEQEVLRLEGIALNDKRRTLQEEGKQAEHLAQVSLNEAETIQDFPIKKNGHGEKSRVDFYKTKTGFSNQPSVITIKSEQVREIIPVTVDPSEITETSYLVDFGLDEQQPDEQKEETETSNPQTSDLPVQPISISKPYNFLPIAFLTIILFGGTFSGLLILRNIFNKNQTPTTVSDSVISNKSESNSSESQTTPENVSTNTPEDLDSTLSNSASNTDNTEPKSITSQAKPKSNIELSRQPNSVPNQNTKRTNPKTIRSPNPKKNPDCIFNNDCR